MLKVKCTVRILLTSGTLIEKESVAEVPEDTRTDKYGDPYFTNQIPDDPFEAAKWFNDNWRDLSTVTLDDYEGFDKVIFPVSSIAALTFTAERLTD